MLWDLIQQVQLRDHQDQARSLEHRVKKLEKELRGTKESLRALTEILELKFGEGLGDVPDRDEGEDVLEPAARAKLMRNQFQTRDQALKQKIQLSKLKRGK